MNLGPEYKWSPIFSLPLFVLSLHSGSCCMFCIALVVVVVVVPVPVAVHSVVAFTVCSFLS